MEVKTINSNQPDNSKNEQTLVTLSQNDTIPSNLIEGGWIIRVKGER